MFDVMPRAVEMALQSIKEAFILISPENNLLHANEAAKNIFPDLAAMRTGSSIGQIENWPFTLLGIAEMTLPKKFEIPANNFYIANTSAIRDKKERLLGYFMLIQDITESAILTKKLEEIANTDELTGILNRRQFRNQAPQQIERTKRLGNNSYIILFDLDHFKKINDTLGHHIGDMVLRCVADRVNITVRPYDLLGRYGGEEFIMLISDISEADVKKYTERIRLVIYDEPMRFVGADMPITISASFGVASVMSADSIDDVIRLADEALYKAKNKGRNRVVVAGVKKID
jgi:diguanylate cyclase (GGDEF)-like protein